jgi:hypothetical protein
VQGADDLFYVAKFKNNLQGPNLLFNECMGTELFRACGLQVPSWTILNLSKSFLESNLGSWLETPEGLRRPEEGLCYATHFLYKKGNKTLEVLPGTFLNRIRNRSLFWLAWLLDICFEHTDHRQAIFQMDERGFLDTFFIDMGNMFGGAKGGQHSHLLASRYLDPRIYPDIGSKERTSILKIVGSIDVDGLWHRLEHIPANWRSVTAEESLMQGLNRLGKVKLLEEILDAMIESQRPRTERYRELAQTRHAASAVVLYP